MRRLRRAAPSRSSGAPARPALPAVDVHRRFHEVLERLAGYVEAPAGDERAAELIRGATDGLLGSAPGSELLLRHAGAYDGNSLLVIALGFSLRRFEAEQRQAAALPGELASRLNGAGEPAADAGQLAEELAGPRRHKRLIAARMAGQAVPAGPEAGMPIAGAPDPPVDAPHSATEEFLAIFAAGEEAWQEIETWARTTGRHVARERNRALLDASGVGDAYDVEPLVDRLDVDFLFRFGYVVAACEEELSRAGS